MLERLHVRNLATLPVFSFPGHTLDIVLTRVSESDGKGGVPLCV